MEPRWLEIVRDAWLPMLAREDLLALKQGLEDDDPDMLQNATVAVQLDTQDNEVEFAGKKVCGGACLTGYPGWKGQELDFVNEVEEYVAAIANELDRRMGEPACIRHIFNAWDYGENRSVMRLAVLKEVNKALGTEQCTSPSRE